MTVLPTGDGTLTLVLGPIAGLKSPRRSHGGRRPHRGRLADGEAHSRQAEVPDVPEC